MTTIEVTYGNAFEMHPLCMHVFDFYFTLVLNSMVIAIHALDHGASAWRVPSA